MSAFSPYTDSPASPALPKSPRFPTIPPSPKGSSPRPLSISEIPEQSPITSNGTDIDESTDDDDNPQTGSQPRDGAESSQASVTVNSIDTTVPNRPRSGSDTTPQSVIHAPRNFKDFESEDVVRRSPAIGERRTPSPSHRSDFLSTSPTLKVTQVDHLAPNRTSTSPVSPPPISTDVSTTTNAFDGVTPRAQTRQEAEALREEQKRAVSRFEDIPENSDLPSTVEESQAGALGTVGNHPDAEDEIKALETALGECWTLCNTLAGLSSIHRERIFSATGAGDMEEQAWKCCWKLCQKLYENRDDTHDSHVRPTLDLCREFCQSLFEVRLRENELADSVLRVSFELNNHLYNTHDRNLPEAFRERTLDFYITLCHRLMKQRNDLAEETDSLLRACWSLAEMLFSLRQNKRDDKPADEELLGSAVQACWELCDLFREGWTQVRPDRGTPRPSQTTFTQSFNQLKQSDLDTVHERQHTEPETPTTIFEDVAVSPDGDEGAPPPNILVLGTENQRGGPRWSSNASTLSGYSQSSADTSSTATTTAVGEDANLIHLKVLIIRAAMNSGFQRAAGPTLHTFVKSLSAHAFGGLPWQTTLLDHYKRLILTDQAFRAPANLPARRSSAVDVARAIQWMVRSGQYLFLRDLYRLVFGFHADEAERRGNVYIHT
ncbi:MAG: hypothetical protein M1817_000396 [Caeruleum heppii]|nr:MAG: hypothetical protein M1817_000396 [Caeruleum heppii]